jgi:hypothetical protein
MVTTPSGAQLSEDGQWWWDGSQWQPVAAASQDATDSGTTQAADTGAGQVSGPGLVGLERTAVGWEMTFEGYTEVGAVAGYLWPTGMPDGVTITPLVIVTEPAQVGKFQLTGLSLAALQTMQPWAANWFAQVGVVDTSTTSSNPPTGPTGPTDAQRAAAARLGLPDVSDADFSEKMRQWAWDNIETGSIAIDVAELGGALVEVASTGEALALGMLVDEMSPIGVALDLVVLFHAVIEAFEVADRREATKGFIYGLGWQVLGMPRSEPVFNPNSETWLTGESFEELSKAFMEGVDNGMQKATEVKVHNQLALRIAYLMATNQAATALNAANDILTTTWQSTDQGIGTVITLQAPEV